MHIAFHDGVFDHGSRLFSALQSSWHNSTEDSSDVNVSCGNPSYSVTNDTPLLHYVQELIPEFFYLPEMFLNENKVCRNNG